MLQPATASIVAVLLIADLYGFRVGSLVSGVTPAEREMSSSSMQVRSIIDNPINAPYKSAQYITGKIHRSIVSQRVVSGLAAGLMILLFYTIASRFFKRYVAVGATLMFATSSALLHIGRSGTADIMLLTIFALAVCGYGARFSPRNSKWLLITSAAIGLSLFVPGMVYFVLAGAIWQIKSIKKTVHSTNGILIAACVTIILASIAPIIFSLVNNPTLVRPYFAIPEIWPSPLVMLKTVLSVPAGILAIAPADPLMRLGRLPLLDVFSGGMFILGCYSLLQKRALDRSRLLIGILAITMLWCGVSGNYAYSLVLLPFVFLVVGAGIAWFLSKWQSVFPRNPLASFILYVLLGAGILLSCNFQVQRYFLAWPNAPATRAAYARD